MGSELDYCDLLTRHDDPFVIRIMAIWTRDDFVVLLILIAEPS